MDYTLRPYQESMVATTMAAMPSDQFILIQAATGAGKTIFFCELIKRILNQWPDLRICVLAHMKTLVAQAKDKLQGVWPEAPIGIACSSTGEKIEIEQKITIGSIQTMANRADKTEPFDIVIIDEAHRVPPKIEESQYKKWIETMIQYNPNTRIIGVTATPFKLGQGYIYKDSEDYWFQKLHYKIGIKNLQDEGHLCLYRIKVKQAPDLSKVKKNHGEYSSRSLSDEMVKKRHLMSIVHAYEDYAQDRNSIVIFCVTIDHAEAVKAAFKEENPEIKIECVHSKMIMPQRNMIMLEFEAGRIKIICNVGVLTEGWDSPAVDCIIMARPTLSTGLYVQMAGRGLRPFEGKEDVLILDLSGNYERHKDIADPKITEGSKGGKSKFKKCPECEEMIPIHLMDCPECGADLRSYKICPGKDKIECGELVKQDVKVCHVCGYEWKEEVEPDNNRYLFGEVQTSTTTPETKVLPVSDYAIFQEVSKKGNDMIRVHLICGNNIFSKTFANEFFVFSGGAGFYARKKWKAIVGTDPPMSYAEAVERIGEIHMSIPECVELEQEKQYWKVKNWNPDIDTKDEHQKIDLENESTAPYSKISDTYTHHECGSDTVILSRNGPHIQAKCSKCGKFIKFVPKEIANGLFLSKTTDSSNVDDIPF